MKKNYTFRLDPELVKKIDEKAKKEKRSRTNLIEFAVSIFLEKNDPSSPAGTKNHES